MIHFEVYLIDFEKGLTVLRTVKREAPKVVGADQDICRPFEYLDIKIHVDSNLRKNTKTIIHDHRNMIEGVAYCLVYIL